MKEDFDKGLEYQTNRLNRVIRSIKIHYFFLGLGIGCYVWMGIRALYFWIYKSPFPLGY